MTKYVLTKQQVHDEYIQVGEYCNTFKEAMEQIPDFYDEVQIDSVSSSAEFAIRAVIKGLRADCSSIDYYVVLAISKDEIELMFVRA
jgi:hypothetical protein